MSSAKQFDRGFSVSTVFEATPDQLYRALVEKSGLEGWLATEAEVDAVVGGRYTLKWPMPEGMLSAQGTYQELEPGKRIVQTWESYGPEGRYEDGDATVTVVFTDLGDGRAEMTQSETSPTYTNEERLKMSMEGAIEAHKALTTFIASSQDR